LNLYVFEIRRQLKSLLVWFGVLALVLLLFMSFFPSMADSDMAQLTRIKLNAIPPAVREALGITRTTDFSDILQYFAYTAQYILMAASIYAAILGVSALVKEEAEGTIEFLYAQPVSRTGIAAMKLLAIFTLLLLFNLLLFAVSALLFEIFRHPGYEYLPMLIAMFKGMLGGQAVFLVVGFALSSVLSRFSNPGPIGLGLFFLTYLLGNIALINRDLEWLKYLSPYHFVQPSTILADGGAIQPPYPLVMLAIVVVAVVVAFWRYRNKDLMV